MNCLITKNDSALNYVEFYALESDCFPAEPFNEIQFKEVIGNDFWVARINGELAGFVEAKRWPDRIHLSRLAVRNKFRKMGIGGNLVDQVCLLARQINSLGVTLTVRTNNMAAYQLYLKKGFTTFASRYRFSVPVQCLPATTPVAFIQTGEGRNCPVSFVWHEQEIAAGRFNLQVGGCKDFVLFDPDSDLLEIITAIKNQLKPDSTAVYVMMENTAAISALKSLPFAEVTELVDMKYAIDYSVDNLGFVTIFG